MTSKEIRDKMTTAITDALEKAQTTEAKPFLDVVFQTLTLTLLTEFVAQVAEMNELQKEMNEQQKYDFRKFL
jgi:uncharacterized membrane protein (DUF106 family)